MANCLVTKYFDTVENSTLPKYGEFRVELKGGTSAQMYLNITNANVVDTDALTDPTVTTGYIQFIAGLEQSVKCSGKYSMTKFGAGTRIIVPLDEIKYSSLLEDIQIEYYASEGADNIEKLSYLVNMTRFRLKTPGYTGDFSTMCAGQFSNGRSSGTLRVQILGGFDQDTFTIDGTPLEISEFYCHFSSTGYKITDSSDPSTQTTILCNHNY